MKCKTDLRDLVLTLYGITLITGLPGNLLSLYIVIQKVQQEAKSIGVLLKEAADMEWTMSYFLCPLSTYMFVNNLYNSTLILMAITVECYLGVAFAVKYKLKWHPRHTVITSVIIWVASMAHCSSFLHTVPLFRQNNAGVELINQRMYAMLFSSFSACLDPFVFYFSFKSLQKMFKDSTWGFLMWLEVLQVWLNIKGTANNSSD